MNFEDNLNEKYRLFASFGKSGTPLRNYGVDECIQVEEDNGNAVFEAEITEDHYTDDNVCYCGKDLSKEYNEKWSYCPYCGRQLFCGGDE